MIKIKLVLILLLVSISLSGIAKQLDTLKVVDDQFITIKKNGGKCFYIQDNKIHLECPESYDELVDKRVLRMNKKYYLMVFYNTECTKLKAEGMALSFSWIGDYKEYDEKGRMIKKGQYLPFEKVLDSAIQANLEIGDWFIYDSTGKQITVEHWQDGMYKGDITWRNTDIWDIEVFYNNKPYNKEKIEAKNLSSINIKLKTKDYNTHFGRYECRLIITGGKMPLYMLTIDYLSLEYFNFQKFITDFWKPGSDLYIEIKDTNTRLYYNVVFDLL